DSARRSRSAVHYVDGSFVLYRSRYLHVLADLVLYHADPSAFPSKVQPPALHGGREAIAASSPPQPRRFRLSEHRRMRSGELHYLDHPVFGLLVQITPYRAAEPAALPPPDSEPENDSDRSPGTEASEPIEGDED
ncbi:MAG: CsiV family protein, partial [Gammaproteobacteria bacterium]